ncbi:Fic family protein [Candidatus Micrarchaeota archaeon]|nr:Fic family protein [Candidatus Micrarchaeota archaeon]
MVFLKTRAVKGIEYYYAVESRLGNQTDVYYFGNRKPTKHEWQAVLNALGKKDDYYPKKPEWTEKQEQRVKELNGRMQKEFNEMNESEKANFYDKFYNDYIYNTNSIEGSTLTKDETYFVTHEKQGISGKSLKEIYMARNLMQAINFLDDYDGTLNLEMIKKLHAIVQENIQPKEELGQYKRRQNYITGTDFLPTPPNLVEKRMNGLVRWHGLNKKYAIFELAALFHIKFVSIHPFIDGNGRVARLLHNFILKRHKIVPLIYRTKTKQTYYSMLRAAQLYGEHKGFLTYTLDEFVATYEGY